MVLKKIKEFFFRNVFVRSKVIICWTIVAIGVLTVALLLTGCNAGWSNFFSDVGPAWSPDGSKITFVKTSYYKQNSNWGVIWVMNADGTNKIKLTDDTEKLNSPAWSPDGTKIAFGGPVDKSDIWVMNADGSNKINLTNSAANDYSPVWSPDGSKIAFVNKSEIWVMNSDGSDQKRLGGSDFPVWSPDGSKIAFSSMNNRESFDIWVMNADGSNMVKLNNKISAAPLQLGHQTEVRLPLGSYMRKTAISGL
jgi:Tol biopolymer transport system component